MSEQPDAQTEITTTMESEHTNPDQLAAHIATTLAGHDLGQAIQDAVNNESGAPTRGHVNSSAGQPKINTTGFIYDAPGGRQLTVEASGQGHAKARLGQPLRFNKDSSPGGRDIVRTVTVNPDGEVKFGREVNGRPQSPRKPSARQIAAARTFIEETRRQALENKFK
jgi:hypothetical protein